MTDADDPVASALNRLPKHVASRTRSAFDWSGSEAVREVTTELPALKTRYSSEIQVHGSCGLAQTLVGHDLIDEYRLFVFPVILGTGKRLFGSGAVPANLQLDHSRTTAAGTVISVYRRGGPFTTGSFALDG